MKLIEIINDDKFSQEMIEELPVHNKVRGIIFNDKNNLVCIEENHQFIGRILSLPGGGVKKNENDIQAFIREVKEETGYDVIDIVFLGTIKLIKKRYQSVTNYYSARTIGVKEKKSLTKKEKEIDVQTVEISLHNALKRISQEYDKNPNYNSQRSRIILNEILK